MRRLWIPTLFVIVLPLLVAATTIAAETRQPREGQKSAAGACADMMQQGGVRAPQAMANMMELARRMGDGDVMLGMTRAAGQVRRP